MPHFAAFDPEAPHHVVGWYDGAVHYPNLPDASLLVAVDDVMWGAHFRDANAWYVEDGRIVERPLEDDPA